MNNGEGDYTAERRKKIEKLNRADFHKFLKEHGDFTKERQEMDISREEFLKYAAEHGEYAE